MSPGLALHLLGPPHLDLDGKSIHLERRKSMALIAYLAVEGGQHQRDFLSSLLWPDTNQSNAFKNLRQILWEIQQSLGASWLVSDREKIGLNDGAPIWLDVHEFTSLISDAKRQEGIADRIPRLVSAAGLYRNHFLSGFSLKDSSPFNDWAFAESENLRRKLSGVLAMLSEDHCALGRSREAIPFARRLVSLDPLDESAHRMLMEVYLQAGQHGAALKQYQTCEQILRKELNLDPQPETRNLYKRIRRGELKPDSVEQPVRPAAPGSNLPHPLSTFIGREKQLGEIAGLFAKSRLVTLAGAGGIGKTSMAVQLGHRLLSRYPDGVWFIALDSLSNPELVPQTVASIFELRETPSRPMLERLADLLRAKTTLLIFDNCEHLLEACAWMMASLLEHCPNLHILATSRETLGVPGEAVYTMPSLSLPESDLPVDELMQYEAIRLFSERAVLALPTFVLASENVQTVVEICRRVDGIPLAIELAAARVNILQVQEILEQLQRSFALLSSDHRALLPRRQTLRASMDWSWGLLEETERIFLSQLSVFAGGWTLESAQGVCDGDVLGLTGALVKKSLILVDQAPGHMTRYHFHEMVGEYMHEKLIQSREEATIRTRHLKYFLSLSELAETGLRGSQRVDWMELLNDEQNNMRSALDWAGRTDLEAGLYLSGRLRRYWESSNMQEGLERMEFFLNRPESRDFPKARANALVTYGWLLVWLQYFDRADTVAEESLSLFRSMEDLQGELDALVLEENVAQFKYDLEAAQRLGERSLDIARSLGDRWQEANALYYLGWNTRDYHHMFRYWGEAIALYRQVGDQVSLANTLGLLGQFRVLNGDFELAETYLDEALQLWKSNRRANIWENPKVARSLLLSIQGQHDQARTMLREVMTSSENTGNTMGQLWARVRLGHAALRAGDLEEAYQHLSGTARDFLDDNYTIGAVFALEGVAGWYFASGKPETAVRLIGWADATRVKIDDLRPRIEQADVEKMFAACRAAMGETALSAAYEAGQRMTTDEAAAYARELT